uniref:Uncharacterized protein n=1 Tax=Arthrobacter sp. 68b TaxID=311808 RepID=A0A0F7G1T1_9MICC|nr:hypothetical protein [Arthrobacter sp. 68b]
MVRHAPAIQTIGSAPFSRRNASSADRRYTKLWPCSSVTGPRPKAFRLSSTSALTP